MNVAIYYRAKLGISNEFRIGVAPNSNGKISQKNPAFTSSDININFINNRGGYSTTLDNFMSMIRHENKHQIDNKNPDFKVKGNITHAGVYLFQMKHQEFKDSPYKFQSETVSSFMNYLYNAQEKGTDPLTIKDSFSVFNNLNTGFSLKYSGLRGSESPKVENYNI